MPIPLPLSVPTLSPEERPPLPCVLLYETLTLVYHYSKDTVCLSWGNLPLNAPIFKTIETRSWLSGFRATSFAPGWVLSST